MASNSEISMEDAENKTTPDSKIPASDNPQLGYPSFSKLLQGVMAANSPVSSHPSVKDVSFQGQFGMSHQEALASVTAKAAQAQKQQLKPKSSKSSPKPPPSNQTEPQSSSHVTHEGKPSVQHKDHEQSAKEKVDKQDVKNEQANDIPRTPNSDGFSWRKYGQKQVKNSGSSRSYYRCTYYNCYAKKKVQHLDISGRIIAVVYKGDHNHDPPQYIKGSIRKRDSLSAPQVNEPRESSAQMLDDPQTPTSTCRKEVEQAVVVPPSLEIASISERDIREEHTMTSDQTPRLKKEGAKLPTETERCKSSNSDEIGATDSIKDYEVVPFKKRRIKESGKASSESVYRTFKEPKVVVHTAGDVGSSSDGYRWRKYGQKMVKGNPNPRSYYRCSSAGCPVRKHVERATDNSTAIIVTYEGIHDHEKPVPKKSNGSPKSSTSIEKTEAKSPPPSHGPSASAPRNDNSNLDDGDKPTEGGSDKVLESARTLLSIGIELKSC